FRAFQVELDNFKRLFCFERDSSASLHLSHLPRKSCLQKSCVGSAVPVRDPRSAGPFSPSAKRCSHENADEHPSLPPEHCTLTPNVKTGDFELIEFLIE